MNLVTGSILSSFTGAFGSLFDTFARDKRLITVFKEPQKVIINSNSNIFAGYQNINGAQNFQLIPVSGIFSAHILYNYKEDDKDIKGNEANLKFPNNNLRIKVEQDAKNFIVNGKTESILVDGQRFNEASQFKVQNYLGLTYYYFELKQIL